MQWGRAGDRKFTAHNFKEISKCSQVEFYRDNLEFLSVIYKVYNLQTSALQQLLVSGYLRHVSKSSEAHQRTLTVFPGNIRDGAEKSV